MGLNFTESDVSRFVDYCRKNLPLTGAVIRDEYYYASIPLCVIDAVFSISANYSSTMLVVKRVCDYFSIPMTDKARLFNISEQFTVDQLLAAHKSIGLHKMTTEVYQNRQRSSARNGILKSESVYRFCNILKDFEVNNFGDLSKITRNPDFEAKIKQIPGQTSGISVHYFLMLTGDDSYIKADRMIDRFIVSAIGRGLDADDSQELITRSMNALQTEFPQMTPRLMDNLIWSFQRNQTHDFTKGKRGAINPLPSGKSEIRIRLDTDVLDWFKMKVEEQGGGNYQEIINQVLCQFMTYHQTSHKNNHDEY